MCILRWGPSRPGDNVYKLRYDSAARGAPPPDAFSPGVASHTGLVTSGISFLRRAQGDFPPDISREVILLQSLKTNPEWYTVNTQGGQLPCAEAPWIPSRAGLRLHCVLSLKSGERLDPDSRCIWSGRRQKQTGLTERNPPRAQSSAVQGSIVRVRRQSLQRRSDNVCKP